MRFVQGEVGGSNLKGFLFEIDDVCHSDCSILVHTFRARGGWVPWHRQLGGGSKQVLAV